MLIFKCPYCFTDYPNPSCKCNNPDCYSNNVSYTYTLTSTDLSAGKKFDSDKLRMDLIPPEVLVEIGKVLTYGAKKYDPNNWQKVEAYRYIAALYRHLTAWQMGEECDQESNLRHLSHALTNLSFLLWKEIHNAK